jgi:hypothetical protein
MHINERSILAPLAVVSAMMLGIVVNPVGLPASPQPTSLSGWQPQFDDGTGPMAPLIEISCRIKKLGCNGGPPPPPART